MRSVHRRKDDDAEAGPTPDAPGDSEKSGKSWGFAAPWCRQASRRARLAVIAAVVLALCFAASFETIRQFLLRSKRIVSQSNGFTYVRTVLSPRAKETRAKAERYFDEQWPLVNASASTFPVHWYFAKTQVPPDTDSVTWYDIVQARIESFARLLKEENRDDFRVEKDRCEMYRFFERARLPHIKVAHVWTDSAEFAKSVRSGEAFKNITRWPAFFKACHLTQGSMKAVMAIRSKQWAADNVDEVLRWVATKWQRKADDYERPWREAGNALTDTLVPGILIQEAWYPVFNPYKNEDTVVELKVEVLWGRAYIAVTIDLLVGTAFLRDGTVELYPTAWSQFVYAAEHELHPDARWVQEPGYLDCVWELSERAAAVIASESVRIDVFLRKGHPAGCVLNEISLSSGMQLSMHFSLLAKVWALPLVFRNFPIHPRTGPVYLLTEPNSLRNSSDG
ncbi:hypothetical protein DIPPA_04589 [Diplonema papillatum]|nr:hypothetical protein DIPPA_04589 [Diplonema papillatum]